MTTVFSTADCSVAPRPAAWQSVIDGLEQRGRAVHAQISCYPTPIPACDADFAVSDLKMWSSDLSAT